MNHVQDNESSQQESREIQGTRRTDEGSSERCAGSE